MLSNADGRTYGTQAVVSSSPGQKSLILINQRLDAGLLLNDTGFENRCIIDSVAPKHCIHRAVLQLALAKHYAGLTIVMSAQFDLPNEAREEKHVVTIDEHERRRRGEHMLA